LQLSPQQTPLQSRTRSCARQQLGIETLSRQRQAVGQHRPAGWPLVQRAQRKQAVEQWVVIAIPRISGAWRGTALYGHKRSLKKIDGKAGLKTKTVGEPRLHIVNRIPQPLTPSAPRRCSALTQLKDGNCTWALT